MYSMSKITSFFLVLLPVAHLYSNTIDELPAALIEEHNNQPTTEESSILEHLEKHFCMKLRKFRRRHIDNRFINDHGIDIEKLISEEAKQLAIDQQARSKKGDAITKSILQDCKNTECYEKLITHSLSIDEELKMAIRRAKSRIKSTINLERRKKRALADSPESRASFIADLKRISGH